MLEQMWVFLCNYNLSPHKLASVIRSQLNVELSIYRHIKTHSHMQMGMFADHWLLF